MRLSSRLFSALQNLINRYMPVEPELLTQYDDLIDKVIAIELPEWNVTVFLQLTGQGLGISDNIQTEPDLVIRGSLLALIRQYQGQSTNGIELIGDPTLAQRLQKLLDQLKIDGEEWLSPWLEDALAHRLGQTTHQIQAWNRQMVTTLLNNSVEYLQQEAHDLPPKPYVDDFLDAVDQLRDDVERLEARIKRLQHQLG